MATATSCPSEVPTATPTATPLAAPSIAPTATRHLSATHSIGQADLRLRRLWLHSLSRSLVRLSSHQLRRSQQHSRQHCNCCSISGTHGHSNVCQQLTSPPRDDSAQYVTTHWQSVSLASALVPGVSHGGIGLAHYPSSMQNWLGSPMTSCRSLLLLSRTNVSASSTAA